MNVKQFLEKRKVPFQLMVHPSAYDASHLAQAVHVPGRHVAKTVLLRVNHGYADAVAVLPATFNVDLNKVAAMLGGAQVTLGTEQDIASHCPDCEAGVLPPFGSQYGMRTLLDESLAGDEIVFEANTHDEAIRMKCTDFQQVEGPLVGHFATAR